MGFSDPDNIQPLLDYWLPGWGYTNFFWDFSLNGNLQNRQTDQKQNSATDHRITSQIFSSYTRYRESEARISEYSLSPFLEYSFLDQSSFNDNEMYDSNFRFTFSWNFNEKFYQNDSDLFFTGSFFGVFRQTRVRDEQNFQEVVSIFF